MSIRVITKDQQGKGAFNGGEIIENKPIGFPQDGGAGKPYSSLFYWAYAEAKTDSTIGLHPHQGFEIMSFVLNGSIRHYDTQLKDWITLEEGDAQIIRAGNGISHAEFMAKDAVMFQIWVDPNLDKTLQKPASYSDYRAADFPKFKFDFHTVKTFSGEGAPIIMDTPGVTIEEISFEKSFDKILEADRIFSVYVRAGSMKINGHAAAKDDFVIISESELLQVESETPGKLFVIGSPAVVGYKTYAEIMQERMRQ